MIIQRANTLGAVVIGGPSDFSGDRWSFTARAGLSLAAAMLRPSHRVPAATQPEAARKGRRDITPGMAITAF